MNDTYIQICIPCCQINSQNKKTLPLICPRTNMPCFAIEPNYLIPEISEEMEKFLIKFNAKNSQNANFDLRIPMDCKYISQEYLNTRYEAFNKLAKEGNKFIYTMPVY